MSHRFSVWAPRPDRVELVVGACRLPMSPSGGGWWQAMVEDAGPGSRYGFSLDGGPTRPDPRSLSQPDGIDGPSEVIDHGAYRWSDRGWRGVPLAGAVTLLVIVSVMVPPPVPLRLYLPFVALLAALCA